MASTLIDLREYVGQWVAQRLDGEVLEAAPTYAELIERLRKRSIDPRSVAITEVQPDAGIYIL